MRNRAWRRAQNKRIINKRKKIVKDIHCQYSGSIRPEETWEWKNSGHLRKWNLTCDHFYCKIDKHTSRIERRQKDKEYERAYMAAFRCDNF